MTGRDKDDLDEILARIDRAWAESGLDTEEYRRLADDENKMVTDALRAVGMKVASVYDLVNSPASYPGAVPVLIEWLPKVTHHAIVEGIARALTVDEARPQAAPALVVAFEAFPSGHPAADPTKWAIGNALSVVADEAVADDLLRLARDPGHGTSRRMLVVALGNLSDRVVDVLLELLDDEDVAGHAVMALGGIRAERAKPAIERFLDHPEAWVRGETTKALKRIGAG